MQCTGLRGIGGLIFVLEQLQVFVGGTFCASRLVFLGAWCSYMNLLCLARFLCGTILLL